VRNHTRDTVLAHAVEVADTSAKRRTGLLKHEKLEPGEGLWIVPCESVHTFFMKFPIDLLYLDPAPQGSPRPGARCGRGGSPPAWLAHSVLELPAGTVAQSGTQAATSCVIGQVMKRRLWLRRGVPDGVLRPPNPSRQGSAPPQSVWTANSNASTPATAITSCGVCARSWRRSRRHPHPPRRWQRIRTAEYPDVALEVCRLAPPASRNPRGPTGAGARPARHDPPP